MGGVRRDEEGFVVELDGRDDKTVLAKDYLLNKYVLIHTTESNIIIVHNITTHSQ